MFIKKKQTYSNHRQHCKKIVALEWLAYRDVDLLVIPKLSDCTYCSVVGALLNIVFHERLLIMAVASQNNLATQDSVAKSFAKAPHISTIFIPEDKFKFL